MDWRDYGDLWLHWTQGRLIVFLALLGVNLIILGIALAGLVSARRARESARKETAK